jgi:hypothetical protein
VSIQWKEGKLWSAEIRSQPGELRKVRSGDRTATLSFKSGEVIRLNADLVKSD